MPNYSHGHVPVQVLVAQTIADLKEAEVTGASSLPTRVDGRVALTQTMDSIKTCLEANGITGLPKPGVGPVSLSTAAKAYRVAADTLMLVALAVLTESGLPLLTEAGEYILIG